jgi:hypothetical protein
VGIYSHAQATLILLVLFLLRAACGAVFLFRKLELLAASSLRKNNTPWGTTRIEAPDRP